MKPRKPLKRSTKPIAKKSAKKLAHEFAMQGLSDMAFIAHITRNQTPIPKKREKPRRKVNPLDEIFPNENDVKKEPVIVRVMKDGREVVNLLTKAGRNEYERRKDMMFARQGGICCLHGFIDGCPGKLKRSEAVYEHESGRGQGGGTRDDRIVVNGRWQNGVSHPICNSKKASVRIKYNDGRGI